jgi:hypothetical protein
MDQLAELQWQVPKDLNKIMHSLELVYQASLDVLKSK